MCWTSSPILRRGTTIVIGICIGDGGSTSGRRRCSSGRRCVSSLQLGGAGSLSGRLHRTNCCSVLKPSTVARARRGAVLWLVGAAGRSWCSGVHLYAYSERRQRWDQNGQHTHETTEVGGPREREPGRCRTKRAAHSSLSFSRGAQSGVRLWRDLSMAVLLVSYRTLALANDRPRLNQTRPLESFFMARSVQKF